MKAKDLLPAACAVLLLAGAPRQGAAAELIHVGITKLASDITLFLADKKGYFREAGIEADFVPFDSAAKMIAPLGIGELQVGAGAPSSGLYNAERRGIGIKIIADKATATRSYSYKALLVRKAVVDSGKFRSLADLKGLKVAVVAKGSADNSILNEAAKAGGLTLAEVDRVYVPFSQQPIALDNGAIDAAITAEPDVTRALRLGSIVRFMPTAEFYPDEASAVILYNGDFIAKQRDTATRFITAYLRAVRDYDAALKNGKLAGPGAEEIIQLLVEVTQTPDATIFRDMVPSWCNPDGKVNMASMNKDLAFFKAEGEVPQDASVDDVLDPSFVDAALKQIGPSPQGTD